MLQPSGNSTSFQFLILDTYLKALSQNLVGSSRGGLCCERYLALPTVIRLSYTHLQCGSIDRLS